MSDKIDSLASRLTVNVSSDRTAFETFATSVANSPPRKPPVNFVNAGEFDPDDHRPWRIISQAITYGPYAGLMTAIFEVCSEA